MAKVTGRRIPFGSTGPKTATPKSSASLAKHGYFSFSPIVVEALLQFPEQSESSGKLLNGL